MMRVNESKSQMNSPQLTKKALEGYIASVEELPGVLAPNLPSHRFLTIFNPENPLIQ